MHAQFAGASAEQITVGADDVAYVEMLKQVPLALAHGVLSDIDLKARAILEQVSKSRLSHPADSHHTPGNTDSDTRLQLLRCFVAVIRQNAIDRVSEIEAMAVGLEPERFDVADPVQPLAV